MPAGKPRKKRSLLWPALLVVGAGVVAWLLLRPGAASRVSLTRAPEEPAPGPAPAPRPGPARPLAHAASAAPAPADSAPQTEEERFLARMAETKKALLDKMRYPVDSRPLAPKTDMLMPHHVEPTIRGLAGEPGKSHGVVVTQNQDRVWVSPGQPAVASITAMQGDQPVALSIQRSDLVPQIEGPGDHPTPGPIAAHPTFHDDGVAPDTLAGDGTWTAAVSLPQSGAPGAVVLQVDCQAGGEQGTLLFNFVATAAPPAVFTQAARDALEDGSIAVYVGIQVQVPGTYEIVGRLYDSTGAPVVYMRFLGPLTPSSTEVRLPAFGKVILDEGGVPPFVLRDVEGAEMLLGQYPDRAPMADWAGPYTTANYALSQLSDADYDGPDKQQKITALDKATQDGLANIRANPTPTATAAPAAP